MDEKILEQAGDFADGMVKEGITKSQRKLPRPPDFDGTCSCGAEIPAERIAMELYNCVDCQSDIERRSKLFGSR